jgi:two-component sensor histidine kinase
VDGEYSMCRLLDEAGTSFDAVVGADDYLILAGLPALAERGIRVPDDVAVAGFDDMPEAMVASPPLTTAVPPFAEMGRRGMELLLERISGRTIPETVILPIGLARRNSCGCPERFETQRGAVPAPDLGLARSLRDQFALEARGEGRGDFLDRFRSELEKAADAGADPIGWLQVMAAIQRDSAPWFSALPSEARLMAADLGARAQELVAETIRRQLTRRRVTLAARHSNIRALSERLSGVYDLERQMDVVASLLVRMGIAGCYISLFADPEDPTGEARLVLAQGQEGRRVLPPEGLAFPASELVPGPRTAAAPGLSRLAQALFFGRERLGFVVFEIEGKENALLCEILRWEISGVLKGAAEFRAQMAAAAEKATMLKELQHRIKNSISIIAGIVGLESEEAAQSETRTALSKLQTRIMAIGDLYEALYDSGDAGKIDLADYLSRVVDSAAKGIGAGPGRVSFESRGEGCEMDLKRAVSLGLIVNELVTDSLKHAFPDGRSGDVGVRLYREAEELAIEVWDDGVGFPAGFDPAESESFGLKMVSLLAAQVRGKLAFSNRGPGANTSLRLAAFPKET